MTIPRNVLWLCALLLTLNAPARAQTRPAAADFNALVFSKTLMFRHPSITNGIAAIQRLGAENRFRVEATEDASCFTPANLAKYRVVIFLSTSGDILNEEQQAAFKSFIEHGGGLAAIHAAVAGDVATEGSWPWYGGALCARFTNHSAVVQATVEIEDRKNPSTAPLPEHWVRADEWYNFISTPRGWARVLASVDETTYTGGTMGKDHPVAWCKQVGKGRIWYTALGHTEASFTEPLFLKHLLGGIQSAAGTKRADFKPRR
ncbi:MAG: ThuA domain-containing protein [Verrucomicrobiota bacterium]